MVSRRQFIAGVATASTVVIAGCSNSSSSGSSPLIGGGSEVAVEQFFTAAQTGDVDSANEVLHPESPQYPVEEGDLETSDDFTVNIVDQVSPRELVEREIEQLNGSGDGPTDEEIEKAVDEYEEQAEETIDEIGADDHAYVWVSVEADGEENGLPIETVQDDGDWYVLRILY